MPQAPPHRKSKARWSLAPPMTCQQAGTARIYSTLTRQFRFGSVANRHSILNLIPLTCPWVCGLTRSGLMCYTTRSPLTLKPFSSARVYGGTPNSSISTLMLRLVTRRASLASILSLWTAEATHARKHTIPWKVWSTETLLLRLMAISALTHAIWRKQDGSKCLQSKDLRPQRQWRHP